MDSLVNILPSVTVSAAVSSVFVWLLQNWISERLKNAIQHEYDTKLESHKAQLKASLDIELEKYKAQLSVENVAATERLKSQLQVTASEHQIRFAKLHENVAEVVAETYTRLYKLASAVERYVGILEWEGGPSKQDLRMDVAKEMKYFTEYFRPRRLYLPKQIADRINELEKKLFNLAEDFKWGVEAGGDERSPGRDTWLKVDKAMREEARPLLTALEDEFRSILGVR
jgi:nitrogen fixation/metabolism regulation signal transduction histidine kinase